VIGLSRSPQPSSEPSKTIVPRASRSSGEMKASPAGRLPHAPGARRSPSSQIASRCSSKSSMSVPLGAVTRQTCTPCGFQRLRPAIIGDWRAGSARDRSKPAVVCAWRDNTRYQFAGILRERRDSNPRPPA
jgi:hypothetical protein